jgi:hypothetical protein
VTTWDLHADAAKISDSSPAIKLFAEHVADTLQPIVTPPPSSKKLWGIAPSDDPFTVAVDTQMADYVALGVTCPRFGSSDTAAASARSHGFKKWVAFVSGDGSAAPSQVVAYAAKYPEAYVGWGNELNLKSQWTSKSVAALQIAVYNAMKAAGFASRVVMSSVGNSKSAAEGLLPLDWCAKLAAAGCKPGTGFTYADYHMYAGDPQHYDDWMHVWTPDTSGRSCQSIFGHPPFFITEFGARIGKDVDTAAEQESAAKAWVAKLGSMAECAGGMWFQDFEGTDPRWTGFGLHGNTGVRRPSWQAYKDAIA